MPRLHLFEIEDQPWCPPVVRRGAVRYLNFIGTLTATATRDFVAAVADGLQRTATTSIIDLCSGASGPVPSIVADLRTRGIPATACLTDYFPEPPAMAEIVARHPTWLRAEPLPVDARAVPHRLAGFRLLCSAFHHFRPDDAQRILSDAVGAGQGIGIYELPERRLPTLIMAALSFVFVPLSWPLMWPWRFDQFLLTFVLPVIPLVTSFDGVVSTLRAYTPSELRTLTERADPEGRFDWRIGRTPYWGILGATWLVGMPRADQAPASPSMSSASTSSAR